MRHVILKRCSISIALSCVVFAAIASAQNPKQGAGVKLSRFERTIEHLQLAPAAERAGFAIVALTELAAVYIAEADLARAEAATQTDDRRAGLLGWSIAVEQYANQLMSVLDDVEEGFPVSLRSGRQGPPSISVADRVVILGHPRADQQLAFAQRVLTDFCNRLDCQWLAETAEKPEPIPASVARVNPVWAFTRSGPVCSNDGLEVIFHGTGNLAILRGICEELAQEVAALATALALQRRDGVAINWNGLAISPTPGRPEHLVRLNEAGDSVLLTLPLLYSSHNLLADLRPWLSARARGDEGPSIRLDAANYGWLPPAR